MTRRSRHPGLLASGSALLVVALLYLSGVAYWVETARPLYVTVVASLVGGVVAGYHTDHLRVGLPPGFLALLATTLVFEPATIPSLAAIAAVLQFLLPVAVLAGCLSGLVAVVLDHHVFDDDDVDGEAVAGDESGGEQAVAGDVDEP